MSCYKSSNNKYFKCPPRMDDGRHFTDYRPNCHVNNLLKANNAILNSHQYRMFLTHNATKLIDLNNTYTVQKNGCGPCMEPYNQGTMLEEQIVQNCNNNSCYSKLNNKKGIGLGRKYDNDSSKCIGWPEQLPVNQPYNCCADTNSLFNYYNDIDTKAQGELITRNSVPSGGTIMSGGDPKAYNF